MSEFILVEVNMNTCIGISKCGKCVQVCPVNIFGGEDERPFIVEQSEDECTLCDLCLEECKPKAISIQKLYD